jgi:predicted patatin/cPLA2 family phospholipase
VIYGIRALGALEGEGTQTMDFIEKAKIRLEHWITHNDHHQEEYEMFVEQLESAGKKKSAEYIREMTALNSKSTACLRKALEALET